MEVALSTIFPLRIINICVQLSVVDRQWNDCVRQLYWCNKCLLNRWCIVTKFSIISIFPGRHWKESTTLLLFAMARHGVTSLYWLYAKICWYGAEGYKNRHDRSYCRTLQVCLWKLVKLSVLECTFFYYRVRLMCFLLNAI